MKQLITILALLFTVNSFSQTPAFPCAEGYGKYSKGGRGGQVIKVTNLNDSGPGSLRAACETVGPRIIVFEVGGRIEVSSTISVKAFCTIAGQTAPGDGICIGTSNANRNFTTMRFNENDIIIRYIRFRRNDTQAASETNDDNLSISEGAENIMVDHCSFSQATDEALSLYDYNGNGVSDTKNITFQNNIIGRAYKGSSKGQIASGALSNISWYKNLWVSNFQRNVLLKNDEGDGATADTEFEFINNVIYNAKFKTNFSDHDSQSGLRKLNYINNHYFEDGGYSRRMLMIETPNPVSVYVKGNVSPSRPTISNPAGPTNWAEEWLITQGPDFGGGTPLYGLPNSYTKADSSFRLTSPLNTPIVTDGVPLYDAVDIFDSIKATVGASLPARDAYDAARVSDAENLAQTHGATGEAIQTYNSGTVPTDANNDGISDAWFASNVPSGDTYNDTSSNGYTWIEEYINSIAHCNGGPAPTPSSCNGKNAPVGTMLTPLAGTFTKADTVSFSVSYTSDTTVSSVTYYLNGTLLSTTSTPFTHSESGLPQGSHTVYAVIQDVCGNTSNTDTVNITVTALQVSACSASTPPVIDGIEDAMWNTIPYQSIGITKIGETATDTNDLKASYKIAWDATSLYFFVKVKDDTLISDSPGINYFFRDDAVCVFIDGLDEDNTSYDANDFYMGFEQGITDIAANNVLYTGTAVDKSDVVTADGYNMEIRIDWSFIGITPTVGNDIGLDLRIDDDDNGGPEREHHLLWNDETSTLWNNPSKFGILKLVNTACNNSTNVEMNEQDEIAIYPNPTNGELTIKSNSLINKIEVYNSLGVLVLTQNEVGSKTKELNISKLPKGVYSLRVFENNRNIEKQIIKQ